MKILELNFENGWRGGERQTFYSMCHFRDRGAEVSLIARQNEPLATLAKAAGFEVFECTSGLSGALKLAQVGRQFDLVQTQTASALTWAVLARPLYRRPLVATRRVAFPITKKKTLMKYRAADHVTAVSAAAAEPIIRDGTPVTVIPSAVQLPQPNAQRIDAFKTRHGLHGKHIVGTSAALKWDKDPLMLVAAVAQLKTPDTVLVHFGRGEMTQDVQREIKSQGLEGRYLLAGFEPEVEQFYAMMDVFVMSSIEEGLGSSVLDAYLARIPVASTDAGGLKEALAEGRGLASPVSDPIALAHNIDRLLADSPEARAHRQTQIETAHAWVTERCSVATMGDAYLKIFEQLVSRKR